MKSATIFFLCAFFFIIDLVHAEHYSIMVHGIPRPVTMTFPNGFTPPGSTTARMRRERFLEFYRQNSAMRGRYSEVLLRDWESNRRLPQIIIGTLGSTEKQQGGITLADWSKIREMLLKTSSSEVTKIRERIRPAIEANSPIATRMHDELIWLENQRDNNSVVVLAQMRYQLGDDLDDVFSARKLIFHRGYILFANVVVDSSKPYSLDEIRLYLSEISIDNI